MSGQLDKLSRCDFAGSLEVSFLSTPVGEIVAGTADIDGAILRIVLDFVQIKIGCEMKSTVLNRVCEDVFNAAKRFKLQKILQNNFEPSEDCATDGNNFSTIQVSPVDVFETVSSLRTRIQLSVAVFNIVDGLEDMLNDSLSGKVFNLDIVALHSAFDVLDPNGSEMLNHGARTDWSNKVTTLSTYVKQLEGLVSKEQLTDEDADRLAAIRKKCRRAEMLKLFLDHVLQKGGNLLVHETVCLNLRLLFAALKDPDFFSGPHTFKKVKKAIDSCCRKVGEAFLGFKGIQECIICLETIRMPVFLSCGHVGCRNCFKDYFQVSLLYNFCFSLLLLLRKKSVLVPFRCSLILMLVGDPIV